MQKHLGDLVAVGLLVRHGVHLSVVETEDLGVRQPQKNRGMRRDDELRAILCAPIDLYQERQLPLRRQRGFRERG